jgi:hypothetical protein
MSKAAQGFAVRRTPVRRSRKPAENAAHRKNNHLWMETNELFDSKYDFALQARR